MEAKMSSKNQIVIPKEVRHKLELSPGSKLHIKLQNGAAVITKAPSIDEELDKILKMSEPTKTDAVARIRKLREEWE